MISAERGIMISVIVPTINRPASLQRLLDSIKKNTHIEHEVIVVGESKCYSEAVNKGIKKAKGEFITIPGIADDIEVTDNWLKNMVGYLKWNKSVGMGAFTVLKPDLTLEAYGGFVKPERYNLDSSGYPDYCGYGLVRREVFDKVGYMDERFTPIYCEDADYGLRVWEAGYKVGVCEDAKIIHYHEQKGRKEPRKENREYLLSKHKDSERL